LWVAEENLSAACVHKWFPCLAPGVMTRPPRVPHWTDEPGGRPVVAIDTVDWTGHVVFRRGLPAELRVPLWWLFGGRCPCMKELLVGAGYAVAPTTPLTDCPWCGGLNLAGDAPDKIAEVFRFPVGRIELAGREPYGPLNTRYHWYDTDRYAPFDPPYHPESDLPPYLYRRLGGFDKDRSDDAVRVYDSAEAAVDALSAACAAEGRARFDDRNRGAKT
jgi:hypothetical protein